MFFLHYLLESVCHPSHFGNLGDTVLISGSLFISKDSYWFYFHFCWGCLTNRSFHLLSWEILYFLLTLLYIWHIRNIHFFSISASRLLHAIGENSLTTLICSIKIYDCQTQRGPSIILGKCFLCCVFLPCLFSLVAILWDSNTLLTFSNFANIWISYIQKISAFRL